MANSQLGVRCSFHKEDGRQHFLRMARTDIRTMSDIRPRTSSGNAAGADDSDAQHGDGQPEGGALPVLYAAREEQQHDPGDACRHAGGLDDAERDHSLICESRSGLTGRTT